MADPVQNLTFLAWVRDRAADLASGRAGGRAAGTASITLQAADESGAAVGSHDGALSFLLAGPADVVGLAPGAVVRRFPAPGTLDHESDRCPYVELAEPSLPWRYTPVPTPAATAAALHPWLVLVVGEEGPELTLGDGTVTIEAGIQGGAHAVGEPGSPCRFAHVQADAAGHRVARVLCGRPLQPGTDYVAALVPAYDADGTRSWTGAEAVTVPAYDVWRFRTAVPAGSFEDLAARLRPGAASPETGRAGLRYPRVAAAPALDVGGALVADPSEEALPSAVESDLAGLRLPARDPEGRPIVTMPRYGEAWDAAAPDDRAWGRSLNRDPRRRGVAGLGLDVGIRLQEELVGDVLAHLGALQEARQRVRQAVLGVAVSRSLWQRRVPADDAGRLWLLGPALSRLTTPSGTVGERATGDGRTMARGTFSAAARRVLRTGPARTALAASRPAAEVSAVIEVANREPPPPPATVDGLPLDRPAMAAFERARRETIDGGRVDPRNLLAAAADLANAADARVKPAAGQVVAAVRQAVQARRPVPWSEVLIALASSDAGLVGGTRDPVGTTGRLGRRLNKIRDRFGERADDGDLTGLLSDFEPLDAGDPALSPVGVDALASGVSAAFDPTTVRPPVVVRVLDTIGGDAVDPAQPLAPPEPCIGLERAAWADLARVAREWLLPGVGRLDANAVTALVTNAVFTEAFLAGLNTQLLAELRWRNVPVATGCTPIRRFWDRADTSAGTRVDDIVGVASWAAGTDLGDASHRPPGVDGQDAVIAVRGELFRRYPTTLVYLRAAADFDRDPDDAAPRVLPAFQGRIGDDVAFFGFAGLALADVAEHWVVFEEPPAGYRFANDAATDATSGDAWAAATLAQPVRVLIRGDSLVGGSS